MIKHLLLIILLGISIDSIAQTDRQFVRDGNRLYHKKAYDKAEVMYRKAISKNPANSQAIYNLGCALMMQSKDSAAVVQYLNAAKIEKNKQRLALVYHNIGVICQNHRMYGEAIKAYEQSLRNNPKDNETRYNLALCKRLQKKQGNKNNQNNKQEKDNKNKQDGKDKQNDKEKDKNKGQDNQAKPKEEQMSKDNAEQLLNAAMQSEKATQQRMKKALQKPSSRRLQKNW